MRPRWAAIWAGAGVAVWLLYLLIAVTTTAASLLLAAVDATCNALPLALLAAATQALLRAHVLPRRPAVQVVAHGVLAVGFAVTWYALALVLMAFAQGLRGRGWAIDAFSPIAFAWQSFQGLFAYGLVAAVTYALRPAAAPAPAIEAPPLERYLIRDDEGMRPVDVADIVTITGAQDYAEVATDAGRHLVRMSLGEFERRLDRGRFLRVHRSTIVNFHRLARTEPAGGGRMLAHMTDGQVVPVSRAGAQLLRSLAV